MSQQLFERVLTWVHTEEAIRVLILVGSRARPGQVTDRFSDYDLDLYVTDALPYFTDDSWIKQLGTVWAKEKETDPSGPSSHLVLFEGGVGVDFTFLSAISLAELVHQQTLPVDYQRGYQVLLDKDSMTAQLPPPSYQPLPARKPTEEEFLYAVNVFWFELFHLVKYLHRGELWSVKFRDATLKRRLLQMLEWHAQARHNWVYDTWIVGQHMQSWVEPEIWQALFGIFAHFDKADSWRAVCALLPLYRRLARETAQRLHYAYLSETDEAITTFILSNTPV